MDKVLNINDYELTNEEILKESVGKRAGSLAGPKQISKHLDHVKHFAGKLR